MGKRKSAKKPMAKRVAVLQKTFDCAVCNHERCINVMMNMSLKVGAINCQLCNASFQAPINDLSSEIDVYAEWIDSFEPSDQAYIEAVKNSALCRDENPFKPKVRPISKTAKQPAKEASKSDRQTAKTSSAASGRHGRVIDSDDEDDTPRRRQEDSFINDDEEEFSDRELFGSDDD